jgi:predicted Zn finger-like uncharacterized protein
MIIQCESCRRKYHLDDSRIKPPGSSVRCSKCGHIFFVSKMEDVYDADKLRISDKTPLFEDLEEEADIEVSSLEASKDEEAIPDAAQIEEQSEPGDSETSEESDSDLVDIPTDHQADLEEYIDKIVSENGQDDENPEVTEIQEETGPSEINEVEEETESYESVENSPELFESDDSEIEEFSVSSIEEEISDDPDIDDMDIISGDEESQVEEDNGAEDITVGPSRGSITKSSTGIVARIIYTLITIAAIFIIFIASLVLLINAEILPKGTLLSLTDIVEAVIPLGLEDSETPLVIIAEHNSRWMNTVNGPVFIVSGMITNESTTPVHYVKLKSEYIAGEKKLYEDIFYAGNTFTDRELKASPIQNILEKLDQKNGDIDVNNSNKLAGLNYNIQPGEAIPFFTVFPAEGRVLGLKYNLVVVDYKKASPN